MYIETDKKKIGEIIKNKRKIMGLTQFELAEKVEVHEKQISRIEAGINYPTFVTFAKLLNILKLTFDDFSSNSNLTQNQKISKINQIINQSNDFELNIYCETIKTLKKNLSQKT